MQVWTSAQVGAAFRPSGKGVEVSFGGGGRAPVTLSRQEASVLFADANDIEATTAQTTQAIQALADDVWARDRALRFLLIIIDPEEPEENLAELEECAEHLLQHRTTQKYCLWQFSATPLPEHNRVAIYANTETRGRIGDVLSEVLRLQGGIAHIRERFDAISHDVLPAADRPMLLEAAIGRGMFYELATALADGKDTKFALLHAQGVLRGVVPNAQAAIVQWLVNSPRRKKPEFVVEAEQDQGYDEPDAVGGRSQFEVVLAEQRHIVGLLRRGDLNRARQYVDQLIARQEAGGGDFAVKSLCRLAQEAKRIGLSDLHYEWSNRAVELHPEDAWAQGQLADALVTLGRYNEAQAALAVAEPSYPAFVASNLARTLRRMGDLEGALQAYDAGREKFVGDEDEHFFWTGVAEVHREFGDLETALATYEEAHERFPGSSAVASGRASVLTEMGRFSEALAALNGALKASAGDLFALHGIASVYREQGDLPRAISEYRKLIGLYPGEPAIHCGYAEALRRNGDLIEALNVYEKTIDQFPFIETAYAGKGRILLQQGRYEEAGKFYSDAGSKFPEEHQISMGTAAVAARRGDWHGALAIYDKLLLRSPRNLRVAVETARVLNRMGQPDLALEQLDNVLGMSPGHHQARVEKASSLYLLGRYQDALDLLHSSQRPVRQTEWAGTLITALCMEKLGDTAGATKVLNLGQTAEIPRVRRYMASALALMKLRDNRVADARRVIESAPGEASEVIRLHVSAASREPALNRLVTEEHVEIPGPHVGVREEIIRRFRVIEGGLDAQHTREWLFDEEAKLLMFDATNDDWLAVAA
ncbi:MAG: tetratricopeptide repeat protein [Alphaproteobacteria bacterium]|nr:tetratricopeptide repeat protein [Alphaproteobacteria bacterium]MBU1516205.1 tetratricopeptide repeat protein [Alphaproteobacteria bacterium]MBU2093515.1 tetratricopeptide repeat protein [Alphaproteobacteria bacterium]MBU2153547.1 tetratricopeptide repeat protein [Alphaproteobacteria bacterium]MBU2308177.1 tetratricopeptide repeat protein [Alphaproteobacteria bacterium]